MQRSSPSPLPAYVPALVCGMSIGHLALYARDATTTAALVLAATLLLSIFQPGRAWIHALLVGLSIPAGLALARSTGLPAAAGLELNGPALLPIALPAGIGVVTSIVLRRTAAAFNTGDEQHAR